MKRRQDRSGRRVALAIVAVTALLGLAAGGANATSDSSPASGPPDFSHGDAAIAALGDRLPDVARAHGLEPGSLVEMFRNDPTFAVDGNDELLYVDLAPDAAGTAGDGGVPTVVEPTLEAAFSLASRPGADHTIHLDFDGHVTEGTTWQRGRRIESPTYSQDVDHSRFNDAELAVIVATYEAVAEDFAPFDVNVTTIEPPVDDLRDTGGGDTRWGVRVVITDDVTTICQQGCGGVAYLGSFDDLYDEPVFVFNRSQTGVIEAASHEAGHALNLRHDGFGSSAYYGGHTDGISWGPIMGASYNRTVTQWSAGDYVSATNGEDDLAIISSLTNGNGFGYVPDDHGGTAASATAVGSGLHTGTISTTSDVDTFQVTTTGGLTVDASPHPANPNLDIALWVTDSTGATVATSDQASTLSASVSLPSASGTYAIHVDGTGWGNPFASEPSGWTDYGSLGNYTLDVTAIDGPVDTEAPAIPTGLVATADSHDQVTLGWNPNTETDLASYTVLRGPSGGALAPIATVPAGTQQYIDATVAGSTTYAYALQASDTSANTSAPSATIEVATPAAPVVPDVAVAEITEWGTVSGSLEATHAPDGDAQVIGERSIKGKKSDRYDRAEHIWRIPVTNGNQVLTMSARRTDGGDADEGFVVSWSTSSTGGWTELGRVEGGTYVWNIGSQSGDVYVRVVDTDQTAGEVSPDFLSVDLLQIGPAGN